MLLQLGNREDQVLIQTFYKAIKRRVGGLNPGWFMSDLAEQFYSAWVNVFGPRLLCTWHVDRAWRENLKHIRNDELKVTVYHTLRLLLEETDKEKYELLLDRTINELNKSQETESFANYFQYYVNRKEQWAACYRLNAGINTNMYVEAFHRVLKYVYLKGKVNKRLDKCSGVLLKLARDKGFDRLVKIEKGKITDRIGLIRTRHRTSLKMPTTAMSYTGDGGWKVRSSNNTDVYTVTSASENCAHNTNCKITCTDCGICVHSYTCTCADYLIKGTICKHIHLVHMNREAGHGSTTQQHSMDMDMEVDEMVQSMVDLSQSYHHITSYREGVQHQILTLVMSRRRSGGNAGGSTPLKGKFVFEYIHEL